MVVAAASRSSFAVLKTRIKESLPAVMIALSEERKG